MYINKRRIFVFVILFSLLQFGLFAQNNLQYNKLGFARLESGWEFYPRKTPQELYEILKKSPATNSDSPAATLPKDSVSSEEIQSYTVTVPSYWNSIFAATDHPTPDNYGCYHYQLKNLNTHKKYALFTKDSPGTSCAVYINGKLSAQTGNPFEILKPKSQRTKSSCSQVLPLYVEFSPDVDGTADIIFFVSNYFYRKGGLWDTVFFGSSETITQLYNIFLIFTAIISGVLIFIGLLNILQFLINTKRKEHFFLGVTATVFALRVATAGFSLITILIPVLPSEIEIKLEYLTLWLAPLTILHMLYVLYPTNKKYIIFKWLNEKIFRCTFFGVCYGLGVTSLILPAYFANRMVPILQIAFGCIAVYVVFYIIRNIVRKKKYCYYHLIGCLFLIVGGILDIFYTKSKDLLPISLFPFFLMLFIFVQLILLATIQNDVYKETVKISANLQKLNEAYLRFVPNEFLKLLNKDSIVNVQAGDYADVEMCIMFSKLKITSTTNTTSLDDHFVIFNEFLKQASPIIKKHGGFVSKFLSGGFMELFPSSQKDAIYAALEIKKCVQQFANSKLCVAHKINVGIGIHYGKMIAGTLGEEGRLDDTVISDTVNTVARIESVCERLEKNIIVSQNFEAVIKEENFSYEKLESITVKGKSKPLELYEIRF